MGVDFRRNFGQDNAIFVGLRLARGAYVAIMDDDLQHDPRDLPVLLEKIQEGADVVYADFRVKHHKLWKNLGSWFNGKVAEWVLDKPRGIYLSPYKVIRKEVADLICRYEGPDPYVDGRLFQVTSRFAKVDVEHRPRFAGTSTYTLWRSIAVWARLATSFSVRPLRLVTWCGLALGTLGALLALVVVAYRLLAPERFAMAVAGWASLMVAQLLIGGVQMIFLGVLGEYAGRTHTTVVGKPQATIREVLNAGTHRECPRGVQRRMGRVRGVSSVLQPDLQEPVSLRVRHARPVWQALPVSLPRDLPADPGGGQRPRPLLRARIPPRSLPPSQIRRLHGPGHQSPIHRARGTPRRTRARLGPSWRPAAPPRRYRDHAGESLPFPARCRALVDRMRRAACECVIIAEPIRNLANSGIPLIGAIATRHTDAGLGARSQRFTERSLDDFFGSLATRPRQSFLIPGGREKVYVLDAHRDDDGPEPN